MAAEFDAHPKAFEFHVNLDDNLRGSLRWTLHRDGSIEVADGKDEPPPANEGCCLRTWEHASIEENRSVDSGTTDAERVFRIAQAEAVSTAAMIASATLGKPNP